MIIYFHQINLPGKKQDLTAQMKKNLIINLLLSVVVVEVIIITFQKEG